MNFNLVPVMAFLATLISPAISSTTPVEVAQAQTSIGELQQRSSVTLAGEVVRVQGEDFVLSDGTGQIWIEAERRPIQDAGLRTGDRVTVAGAYDDDNSFEAFIITPANGRAIYVFDD